MKIGGVFKNYKKLVALFASVVVFLGIFSIIQTQAVKYRQTTLDTTLSALQEEEWRYVWSLATALRVEANDRVSLTASTIKSQILESYKTNGRNLEYDIKNLNQNNHPVINIFAKNLQNSYLNGIQTDANDPFIATRTGIASDYSVDCSASGRNRDFEKEISLHYNQILARKAINSLLEVNTNLPLIGWQFREPKDHNWSITTFDEQSLRQLYMRYGLIALDSFEFLTASYIDSRKDLAGNDLVDVNGKFHDNQQFIVVQGFNLYEQLTDMPYVTESLKVFETDRVALIERATWEISYLVYSLIAVFGMMCLIFILGSSLLNIEANTLLQNALKEEDKCED